MLPWNSCRIDNHSAHVVSGGGGSSSVIKSIQQGTITVSSGSNSGTATISSVTTANALLLWNGYNSSAASTTNYERNICRITLTNGTTVTATRESNTGVTVTVNFTVVEFASGVNSIQYGTATITAGSSSGTATISSVGSNAFVAWLGVSSSSGPLTNGSGSASVTLTNSTTVTAAMGQTEASDFHIAFVVADLNTTVVNSIQQRTIGPTSAASTTDTDTITSVTTGNTLLVYGGQSYTGSNDTSGSAFTQVLTNATTVTETRIATTAASRTHQYTAVVFASAALNGNIQRGTIAISSATSNTATITSVDTTKSFVNWGAFLATSANASTVQPTLSLTNGTTVTAALNSSGSATVSYEVIQFA